MPSLSRRKFITQTSGASMALWLGLSAKGEMVRQLGVSAEQGFSPFIRIASDGTITLFDSKPEMGQGTFQSIPALIAEELEVGLDQVVIKLTNGEAEFGSMQFAGGSFSVRSSYNDMRKVGAAAREVLTAAAGKRWNVAADSCRASQGKIVHEASGRSLGYGELIAEAAKLELPKSPKLKDPKDFRIIGKNGKRPDLPLKTCGKAIFGIDVKVPGMVYASVERSTTFGAKLLSYDASETLKFPGVLKVVEAERIMGRYHSTGIAVIANSFWAALKGRSLLKVKWDTSGVEKLNYEDYCQHLRDLASEEGIPDKSIGSVDSLNIAPENLVEAFYETPMVAHHALEPMNCTAWVQGDKLDLWTSTQVPGNVAGKGGGDLPAIVGFKPENVKLHNQFIGGGFGRRLYVDFLIEAVNIARQYDKPVKLVWTREETTQMGPFRPMTFSQMKGGFSADGKLVMFQHKVIGPSNNESGNEHFDKTRLDRGMVEGIGEQAYEIPNLKTSYVRADFNIPIAAWRSVTSSTLAFAHECFIDELAHKAGKDALDFRLEMLTKPSDTKKVLTRLREFSKWDEPLPKGKGKGVAQYDFFAGLCGQVVYVTYANNRISVDKVYAVIDLGEVVNPDTVHAQIEGAVIMALTAAVKPGITFENGAIKQRNFYDSPLIRIQESPPDIEVMILADGGRIKGVGEPGLPPFAPALANAIFNATGKRIRKMPFDLGKII